MLNINSSDTAFHNVPDTSKYSSQFDFSVSRLLSISDQYELNDKSFKDCAFYTVGLSGVAQIMSKYFMTDLESSKAARDIVFILKSFVKLKDTSGSLNNKFIVGVCKRYTELRFTNLVII
jgi:hypothetical protein